MLCWELAKLDPFYPGNMFEDAEVLPGELLPLAIAAAEEGRMVRPWPSEDLKFPGQKDGWSCWAWGLSLAFTLATKAPRWDGAKNAWLPWPVSPLKYASIPPTWEHLALDIFVGGLLLKFDCALAGLEKRLQV